MQEERRLCISVMKLSMEIKLYDDDDDGIMLYRIVKRHKYTKFAISGLENRNNRIISIIIYQRNTVVMVLIWN